MKSAIQTTNFHNPKKIIQNILTSLMLTSIGSIAHADGVFVNLFTARLEQDKKSTQPTDVLLLEDGTIAVADSLNSTVKIFNRNGDYLRSFGEYGDGIGKIKGIISLAKGSKGRVHVSDRGNKRVQFFSKDGKFVQHLGTGPYFEPASSYYDTKSGLIYTVNRSHHKIEVYNSKGKCVQEIGGYDSTNHAADGKLYHPLALFVDNASNKIYISDGGNNRISVFTKSGKFLHHLGNVDGPTKLHTPNKIYKTLKGDIYIADVMNHRVQIIKGNDADGGHIGSRGQDPGQFRYVNSFDIDETTGDIFIADASNQRIQKFFDPNLWNKPGTAKFDTDIDLAQPLNVKAQQTLALNDGMFTSQDLTLAPRATLDHTSNATVIVDGDLRLSKGSTYLYRYDENKPLGGIQTTGKANLAGNLTVNNSDNIPLDTPLTLITAQQGVVGQFDSSKIDSVLIKHRLNYDANNVYLEVTRLQLKEVVDGGNSNLHTLLDSNHKNINPQSRLGAFTKMLGGLKFTAQINTALNELQPAYFHDVTATAASNSSLIKNAVNSQLATRRTTRTITGSLASFAQVPGNLAKGFTNLIHSGQTTYSQFAEQLRSTRLGGHKPGLHAVETKSNLPKDARAQMGDLGIWLQTNGQFFEQKAMHNTVGVHSKTMGLSTGVDYQLTKEALIGVAFGYAGTRYNLAHHNGKGHINSTFIGSYGSWTPSDSGLFIDASAFVGFHNLKGNRITAAPINKLSQKHRGLELTANTTIGYDFDLSNNLHLQPYVAGTLQWLKENGHKEKDGSGVAFQKIGSRTSKFMRAEAGAELSKIIVTDQILWRPSIKLGYAHRHEFGNGNKAKVHLTDLSGQAFTIVGAKGNHNLVTAGAALTVMSGKSMYVTLSYNGDYGKKVKTHEGLLRFGWTF